jgi:hypothetical protein
MASRFCGSCSPYENVPYRLVRVRGASKILICAIAAFAVSSQSAWTQMLVKPSQPGEPVTLMPSDEAIIEADQPRKDIPCVVTQRKPELGFDLRFHSGYDVTMPLHELSGGGELITVLLRVYPAEDKSKATYFVQHFNVPAIQDEAKGDAVLEGSIDLGEGRYHVDWLMRDRAERICSSTWEVEAALSPKDKQMPLFIRQEEIAETPKEPFLNDGTERSGPDGRDNVNVKLLVNFAPQNAKSASLQRSDTEALVSILKTIQRDPHIARLSLVAFNMEQGQVVYRQESAKQIDFPSLGKALQTMKLGTVNVQQLGQKHSETDFLEDLITKEVGNANHPDAVIFAGPKAMLDADVPQDDLRRIGSIECPVFYMNYNLNPQAVPWKDSISHAIRAFKGTEYTISRPRDLWQSTTEMLSRIIQFKRDRTPTKSLTVGGGTGTSR